MNAKYFSAIAIAATLTVGTVGCGGSAVDPCAGTTEEVDPGVADPCAADPCAAPEEDPCAADPCAGS
ncbi:hypothetical protein PN498_09485 [Oscillatoria sp. CS-180]|uniref:hypothetical protein n=1 Tax=Oscillatoria sp. CS-180 TaxID=3021720 RepID=UPI00232E65AA|nr:hypothetical protein [Oscillatoria sp. CS-180]MDB9526217.1 hypothetical protein [Oscillatoria sp. CS-180]